MTVIAWDGKTLAADKLLVSNGRRMTVTKIEKYDGQLLAICGTWDTALEMLEWYKDPDRSTKTFPESARKGEASLLVVCERGDLCLYDSGPVGTWIEDGKFAMGSGRDCAMVAMSLDRSAGEAVGLTRLFRTDCGNGVDLLTLD